ncbi:MAG: HAMP domain-containing sensor histidine kinase [Actinomycetota bacterium]|nr:HAMP domain-containing sensor histidine kinase [Actinomycetota bacterium]
MVRTPGSHTTGTAGVTILNALAGELALGAAVISVTRAWANRELNSAFAAVGLLAFGVYKLIVVSRSDYLSPGSAVQIVGNASLVLAFGFLLLSVVHPNDERSRHHPLDAGVGALIAALIGWSIVRPAGIGILSGSGPTSTTANVLVALAWAVLGLTAIHVGRSEGASLKIWIGFTATCFAQARLSLIVFTNPGVARLANGVLATVAIAVTLLGSVLTLQDSISTTQGMVLESLLALKGSEAQRSREASAHEESVHNLKSALTSINMATHMLVSDRKVPLTVAQKAELEAALRAELDRATRLVSREWEKGCCSFVLSRQLAPLFAAERAQGTTLRADIPSHLVVLANPEKAYEIVATLLDNARRHAPGSVVDVSASGDGPSIVISVQDRGPGLPATVPEKIFERGWTTSAKGEGMGIGLHLAKKLTEEQGGDLKASNRVGGGACFSLTLPAGEPGLQAVDA